MNLVHTDIRDVDRDLDLRDMAIVNEEAPSVWHDGDQYTVERAHRFCAKIHGAELDAKLVRLSSALTLSELVVQQRPLLVVLDRLQVDALADLISTDRLRSGGEYFLVVELRPDGAMDRFGETGVTDGGDYCDAVNVWAQLCRVRGHGNRPFGGGLWS